MSIPQKDTKLLWGKSAGRCAMPDCRKNLVTEASEANPSRNILLGEMAHIIGEGNSSPRGISVLGEEDRNRYPNLILLCKDHHTMVDQDETAWPIEKLHVIKRDHEIWIEEQLGREISEQEQIYYDFVDRVSLMLDLSNWERLCDHLFRKIMPPDFPDGVHRVSLELFRACLPGLDNDFETALFNLVDRSKQYVEFYLSNAETDWSGNRIMGRREYQHVHEYPRHAELLDEFNRWDRNCSMLLANIVKALNEFAVAVRQRLNPNYFIRTGRFCLHDAMGLMGENMQETWDIPPRYFTEEDLNAPINR